MMGMVMPTVENWVRVRIWKPTGELRSQAELLQQRTPKPSSIFAAIWGGQVGHVSLETATFYASVFPDVENFADDKLVSTGKPIRLGFIDSATEDERLQPADLQYDFFSLDTQRMEQCFRQIRDEGKVPYRTFQFLSKLNDGEEAIGYNCSDLTFNLLEQGGFVELLDMPSKMILLPARLSFFTPPIIDNVLTRAKQQELTRFPQVANMRVVK